MRILQLGDSLPDVRVERFIQLDSKLGHDDAFLGDVSKSSTTALELPPSTRLFNIQITRQFRWGIIKQNYFNKLRNTIEDFDPDMIHVHNIYFLNFINEFFNKEDISIPFIYNDHEYWSKSVHIVGKGFFSSFKFFRAMRAIYKSRLYRGWEKKFVRNQVVITVSKNIAKAHEDYFNPKVVNYIPNMPTLKELSTINYANRELQKTVVYIGSDFTVKNVPCRYTGSILNEWKKTNPAKLLLIGDTSIPSDEVITSLGVIPHISLYFHASKAHFGALAYLPHHFHEFISPNKIYIYIHAGALPILPKNVPFEVDVPRFSSVSEFLNILKNYPLPDSDNLQKLAKESLVADNYLDILKHAYEEAYS